MIDFHSHILPAIDDGSKTNEESLSMLESLSRQGVTTVIATPHFYADCQSIDEFLDKRTRSFESLKPFLTENEPKILCGAEVSYSLGISRIEGLERLCIEGTNILLIEMYMSKWSEYTIKELEDITLSGITLVIAHMERYIGYQSKKTIRRLYEAGILMQYNASFFVRLLTRHKAVSGFKNGEIHLIGSDCHNLTSRPPKIGAALQIIEKKLGAKALQKHNEFVTSILKIKNER